jgi:hypothetical protein
MRRLPFLAAFALSALAGLPVTAAPLHITVPGGPPAPYYHRHHHPDQYSFWGNDYFFMNQEPFDSGRAITDALQHVPWASRHATPWMSDETAWTLVNTGDSIASHMLKCQRAYSTYSIVDDSYLGRDGIPRNCRL